MKFRRLLPLSLLFGTFSIASCGDLSDINDEKNEEKENNDDSGLKEDVKDNPSTDTNKDDSTEEVQEEKTKEIVVSSMSFDAPSYTLAVNESKKIDLTYVANTEENLAFTWVSDNPSICGVIDGRIFGMKPGICNVSAYYDSNKNKILDAGEKSATAQVRVYNPNMTIYLDSTEYTVAVNETVTASPSFDGGMDLNPTFSWKSNNTNIATVDNGVITGKSAGTTSIICYYDDNGNSNYDSGIDPFCKASVTVDSSIKVSSTTSIKYYTGYTKTDDASADPDDLYHSINIDINTINLEGDVPYISFNTFQTILLYQIGFISNSNSSSYCKFTEVSDGRYRLDTVPSNTLIGGELRNATLYFDTNNNTITCDNFTKFTTIRQSWNNGIPNDMCSPTGIVKTTSKTKYITNPTENTFNLNQYNIHMHKINNVAYIPLHVALSLNGGYDMYYYDGKKLVDTMALDEVRSSYFYSNNNNFILSFTVSTSFFNTTNYTLTFKRQNNSNDFYAYHLDSSGTYNNFKATLDLANSSMRVIGSRGSTANSINTSSLVFDKTYSVTNNNTFYTFKQSSDVIGYMKLEDNRFNDDSYQEKMKEFNYNFLTFRLDYFYGLKDDFLKGTGYTSFNTYFRNKRTVLSDYRGTTIRAEDTIYNQIMNASNISEYSNMLAYIIAYLLGDGHTLFKTRSPLCGINSNIDSALSSKNSSERDQSLHQLISKYYNARGSGGQQLKISGKTAVIQFDAFNGNYINASNLSNAITALSNYLKTDQYANSPANLYRDMVGSGFDTYTCIYFAISQIIPLYSEVENIVFDVTNNGGGAVLLLPQLTALMTSDPTVVYKDTINGGVGEYHYEVDTNGDGSYDSKDTYADKYNFYVLQSDFSFSCGNAFPSVCKNMGCAKIIGSSRSGGGACPVSYGYDAFGSQFQISARHNIMIKDSNGTYIHNDNGCPADKVLDSSIWYNTAQLDSWINSNF